jgi:hypothetical protein
MSDDNVNEIISSLLEVMQESIDRGDWLVDGACDPDSVICRAKEYLRQNGYVQNSMAEQWGGVDGNSAE